MQTLVSFGYSKKIVDTCEKKGIKLINLIDDFEPKDYLPPKRKNEIRIESKNNANDYFTISSLLKNDIHSISGVISPFEFTLFNSSILASYFNCDTLSIETSLYFRDKILQKNILKTIVPIPTVYSNIDCIGEEDFPLIVKPVDGTGTNLTTKVTSKKELDAAVKLILSKGTEYNGFMIEKYIYGQEFYVDGWVYNGEVQLFMISQYVHNLLNIKQGFIVQGVNLVYKDNEELYDSVYKFLTKIFNKLKLVNGVFHLEFFLTQNGDLIFGECAARLGGVMPESAFLYHWNIDLTSIWIDICLKNVLTSIKEKDNKKIENHTGFTFIPSPKNLIKLEFELPTVEELRQVYPFVVDVEYDWYPGEPIPNNLENTSSRIGKVFVLGNSNESVSNNLNKIVDFFRELYHE